MHDLGIEVYGIWIRIPMAYKGTTLNFRTVVSREHELNMLPHIVLISDITLGIRMM